MYLEHPWNFVNLYEYVQWKYIWTTQQIDRIFPFSAASPSSSLSPSLSTKIVVVGGMTGFESYIDDVEILGDKFLTIWSRIKCSKDEVLELDNNMSNPFQTSPRTPDRASAPSPVRTNENLH